MTDRERLIELLDKKQHFGTTVIYSQMDDRCNKHIEIKNSELADYLLSNGVIVLPCKAGDIVYSNDLDPRFDVEIEKIVIEENIITFEWVQYEKGYEVTECWDEGEFLLDDFGKTVFFTREEAEKALKEREENVRKK